MTKKFGFLTLILIFIITFLGVLFSKTYSNVYALDESNVGSIPYNYDITYNNKEYNILFMYKYTIKQSSAISFSYKIIFDSEYYNNLVNNKDLIKELVGVFKNTKFMPSFDDTNGLVIANLSYDDVTDYYKDIGVTGYDNPDTLYENSESHLFYTDLTMKQKTIFSYLYDENTIINRLYNLCLDSGISSDKILLKYVYESPYSEKSVKTNADEVERDKDSLLYRHTFVLDTNEYDKDIYFYRHTINTTVVYGFIILISFVIMIPIIIINVIKKRKNG
ncbi:MAG: hypothetical protein K5765_08875 [Clostridia bacterium]|nr:hypothetical protein [Clostridia bacterium]